MASGNKHTGNIRAGVRGPARVAGQTGPVTTEPRDDHPHRSVLLRGGGVYSPAHPSATAILLQGDRIAWIGDETAADDVAAQADLVVPLDGRLVTPGFVDAHVHLAQTGFALGSVDLAQARSLVEALDLLAGYAANHSGPVLFAQGWDETRWPEARPPRIDEVDRAVGSAVAYIARIDSHSAIVSSALVARRPELTSADGWTPDGRVERDAHHLAREVTHDLWSAADRRDAIAVALDHAAAQGITEVHELNAPHIGPYSDFAAIAELAAERTRTRVVPYWGAPLDAGEPDGFLFGLAGDLCADGAIGSRTAALRDPYADAPTSGHLYLDRKAVRAHVTACTRAGKQAGFHVIGDRAMGEVTAGLAAAAADVGVEAMVAARHRLEHVEMPTGDDIAVLARLGVVASVQPAFDAAWGAPGELYDLRLGWGRAAAMNPVGSMLRAGVVLAFGSDSPITPLDPWGGVRAATRHHNDGERLTVEEAFDAHTRGGLRARREDGAGVLAAGAPATLVVWDVGSGPGAHAAHDGAAGATMLPDVAGGAGLPRCAQTIVDGVVIHSADGFAGARG